MALGAKVVAPVPKKPDPIAAFEKGHHLPLGMGGVDLGVALTATETKKAKYVRLVSWHHPSSEALVQAAFAYNRLKDPQDLSIKTIMYSLGMPKSFGDMTVKQMEHLTLTLNREIVSVNNRRSGPVKKDAKR